MSKNSIGHNLAYFSRFDHDFILYWEHAFNKFGFNDGAYSLTYDVVAFLEEEGYSVKSVQWGIHNEIMVSIKKDGKELMPRKNSDISIGYDDPRDYLSVNLVSLLDQRYYDQNY